MFRSYLFSALVLLPVVGCGDDAAAGGTPDAAPEDRGTDAGTVLDAGEACGDGVCDPDERCESCALDCGECPVPEVTECNDGIDNDGDGLVDWQLDLGCWGAGDQTERSGSRAEESGWTTFDLQADSQRIYVSTEGDDGNDGLTPETAVASAARGAELVRDGFPDFLLFRRGDTWRSSIGEGRVARRFKSGRSRDEPLVIASYGESTERPRFELSEQFIDDDGNGRRFLVVAGLALVSYRKNPDDPDFDGVSGGAVRIVSAESRDILLEDNYLEYGEYVAQNATDIEIRRNVIYRAYHDNTCAYRPDGSRDPNGNVEFRPSGIFAGRVDGLRIEENVFDENGWNPDVREACATIYNHNMYLSGNDRVEVRDNLILRASSIGIKMAASNTGDSNQIVIEGNVFAEGEIGISMGGNGDSDYRFTDALVRGNAFTDIGRSQPTGRTLTWYVDITDNDRTEIADNLFLNQPPLGNAWGIRMNGDTNREVQIHDNVFANMSRRMLFLREAPAWSDVRIRDNTFQQRTDEACLVQHENASENVRFSGNRYASSASEGAWFCRNDAREDIDGWTARNEDSSASPPAFADPTRDLGTYAALLELGDSLDDFARAARSQSRFTYERRLSAAQVIAYLRMGYAAE